MPKILLRRLRDGDGLIPARTLLQIEGQVVQAKERNRAQLILGRHKGPLARGSLRFLCV